ncbi:MAG: aminotransferase class IV [Flavisolibacter sp.]|nr:aminotransferase class IV [Flavisolibacter sp.]
METVTAIRIKKAAHSRIKEGFIEESGTMNVFFVIDGTLVTPPLSDSIINGITRDSLLQIAKDLHIPIMEQPVSETELVEGFHNRKLQEAFGSGTAAVVTSISVMGIDGQDYHLPPYTERSIRFQLKRVSEDIRFSKTEDAYNWNFTIQ